jgi:AcrR family transcriptional regulator
MTKVADASVFERESRSANADAILELAVKVIDEHGEPGIRVQDLADEVGVAITTLYRFFDNREGLIAVAQLERFLRKMRYDVNTWRACIEGADSAEAFRAGVEQILDTFFDPDWAEWRLRRVNVLGATQSRPHLQAKFAEFQDQVISELTALFAPFQRSGYLRADLHRPTFTRWMMGQLWNRALIEVGDTRTDDEAWNAMTRTAVLHTMFGSE